MVSKTTAYDRGVSATVFRTSSWSSCRSGSRRPIHSTEGIEMARRAARLAAEALSMVEAYVVPGVSTKTLDRICHDHTANVQGAVPANVRYQGYPKTIVISVNQLVCHGIPSPTKVLKKCDTININVAVIKNGWFGDTSRMYFVGAPGVLARPLVEKTYKALLAGIQQVQAMKCLRLDKEAQGHMRRFDTQLGRASALWSSANADRQLRVSCLALVMREQRMSVGSGSGAARQLISGD